MQDNSLAAIILICAGCCLALLFASGGVFMIYQSRRNQKIADASQGWPGTNGTIVEARAVRDYHSGVNDDDLAVTTFSPRLKYTYRVGGSNREVKYVQIWAILYKLQQRMKGD